MVRRRTNLVRSSYLDQDVLTAREAVLMTPRVALVNDRNALGMQVTIEQAVKEAMDFPKAKRLVPSHRLAPRIIVAYAESRDLPARGNQSMTCAEYNSTQACRGSLFFRKSQHPARLFC